ncbi:hypothetical protein [Hymenobacter sp. HDW8]|uniref:hypothetical protein n=1 Tax=Hymenobacter sp. HDW8 TaxID=2714932 RepID=UPI001408E28D|nr:hypothetical protein [Hymenobacter sp. HDW8]QIL75565.1 hypothetical protein G7064_06685 [Hymenobacter sp. HDW8]
MKGWLHVAGCLVGMLMINVNSLAQSLQTIPPNPSEIYVDPAAASKAITKPISRYQFYAGAQAAAHAYKVASTSYPVQQADIYPLYLFVGYHLRPQLAVQVGFLQRNPRPYGESTSGFGPMGQPISSSDYRDEYDAALPVLLRYRLTRLRHRLYLQTLLGVTTEFNRYKRDYIEVIAGQVYPQEQVNVRATNFYLTAGFALGYTVGSRVDIMLEAAALRNLTNRPGGNWDPAKEITPALGIGLLYNFDLGRKRALTDAFHQKAS